MSPEGRRGGLGLCPEGTVEKQETLQSSLRDESPLSRLPGVETPGYCRVSLRDTPDRHSERV